MRQTIQRKNVGKSEAMKDWLTGLGGDLLSELFLGTAAGCHYL